MHFGYQHLAYATEQVVWSRQRNWPNWKDGTEFRAARDAQR